MTAHQRPRVGVTEKNTGTYWDLVNQGWRHAADRLGLDVHIDAPRSEDVDQQRRLMWQQLEDGADALAFVATSTNGFDDLIAQARDRGVPSVCFDLDAPDSGRLFFVGMEPPLDAGRRLGLHILSECPGPGVVYLQNGSLSAPGAIGKRRGLVDVLEEAGCEVLESEPDHEDVQLAERLASTHVEAAPDLLAVVGVYGYHPAVLAHALGGRDVPIYGFDLLPQTRQLIERGRVRGSIWIREHEFGLQAAAVISDILQFGATEALRTRGMNPSNLARNVVVPDPLYVTRGNVQTALPNYGHAA